MLLSYQLLNFDDVGGGGVSLLRIAAGRAVPTALVSLVVSVIFTVSETLRGSDRREGEGNGGRGPA